MATFEPTWSDTATYTNDGTTAQRITFNGVVYSVASPASGTTTRTTTAGQIPFDNDDWVVSHIVRLIDYYSIIEGLKLELKQVADSETNLSMPYFIQKAELSFQRTIRVPQMVRRAVLTSESNGDLRIPSDMLEPINLRRNTEASINQRNISIRFTGDDYQEWVSRQFDDITDTTIDSDGERIVAAPVFRIEGNDIKIAPTPEAGIEYELVYYGSFPQLGTVANLVNDEGLPVNSAGQTSAQWVAAGGTNTAANFVQATEAITTNYYTQTDPDLVFYGALYQAYLWLKETDSAQVALNDFNRVKEEIEMQVEDFLSSAPQDIFLTNGNYQT